MKWIKYKSYDKTSYPEYNKRILVAFEDEELTHRVEIGYFKYRDKYDGNYIVIDNTGKWYYDTRLIAWAEIPEFPNDLV